MSLSNAIQKLKDTQNYLHEHGQSMGSSAISAKYAGVFKLLQTTYNDAVRNHQINENDYKELHDNTFIGNVCGGAVLKHQLNDYLTYANSLLKKQTQYISTAQARLKNKNNPENWNDKVNHQVKHKINVYTTNNKILKTDIKNITPVVKNSIYPQLEYKYRINKNSVRIIPTNVLPVVTSDVNNLVSRGIKYMTDVNTKVEKRYANIPKVGGNQPKRAKQSQNIVYTNQPLVGKSRQQNANISTTNQNAPLRSNLAQPNSKSSKKGGIFHKVVKLFSKPYHSNKAANANTNMNPNYNSGTNTAQQAYINHSRQRSMYYAHSARAKQQSSEAMAQAISRANTPNSTQASQNSFMEAQRTRISIARSQSVSVANSVSASNSVSTSASLSESASISASASMSESSVAEQSIKSSESITNSKKANNTNMSNKNTSRESIAQRIKKHADEIRNITNSNKNSNSDNSKAQSSASSSESVSSKASNANTMSTSDSTSSQTNNSNSVTGSELQSDIIKNLHRFGSLSEINSFSAEDAIAQRDMKINSYKSASSSTSVVNSNAIANLKIINKHKLNSMSNVDNTKLQHSLASQATSYSESATKIQNSLQDSANKAVVSVSTSASDSATTNIAKILTNAHTMAVKSAKDVQTRMSYENEQNKSTMAKSYVSSANTVINNNRANDNIAKNKSLTSQSSAFEKSMASQKQSYTNLSAQNSSLSSTVNSYQNQMSRIDSLIGK